MNYIISYQYFVLLIDTNTNLIIVSLCLIYKNENVYYSILNVCYIFLHRIPFVFGISIKFLKVKKIFFSFSFLYLLLQLTINNAFIVLYIFSFITLFYCSISFSLFIDWETSNTHLLVLDLKYIIFNKSS